MPGVEDDFEPVPVFLDQLLVPSPEAVLILSDPTTRLIHVGERANLAISFPSDYGLSVDEDELLIIEWVSQALTREVMLQWSTVALKPVLIRTSETTDKYPVDAPSRLATSLQLAPEEQLIWLSLVVSDDLQTAWLHDRNRRMPLVDPYLRTTDMYWTRDSASKASSSLELECVYGPTLHPSDGESICGILGYSIAR